jgi:hypothetical protein
MMLWMTVMVVANAQLGLNVTVNLTEAGTLFVKIQEQIEEVGELSDIASLTVTGPLNGDDFNVIRNQLTNMETLDLSKADPEACKHVYLQNHKKVKTVKLPTEGTRLEHGYTFCNCTGLETVVLPQKLEFIPMCFATGATSLANITLPPTVTTIEGSAFQGISSLTEIVLPDGLEVIKSRTFYDCPNLKKVTLPKALTTIEGEAFQNTALETFTLPEGVKLIGGGTFAGCSNLTSFNFPDGLVDEKEVGTSTFWDCKKLVSVRLPQTLTIIPYGFFRGTAIPDIVLPPTVTSIGREAYSETTALKKVKLPNTIKEVDVYAFSRSSIEEMDWSASATIMPSEVFRECHQLKRINIPETVDSLASGVFYLCDALTSVHLPEGIRTLEGTFNECRSLSEVNIPSTVTCITRGISGAFNNCRSITHIDIPDGVTYIGWASFSNVPLTEVKLPSKLKFIGGYAFNGCKLKHVVVPEGCQTIGGRAFYSDDLKVLDLPSTIVSLGGIILGDNGKFHPDSVILRAMVPPYASENMFTRYDAQTTLYVPAASLSLYQANSRYNNVEKMGTIPATSSLLNVLDFIAIDKNSGLQQGKYDVSLIDTYWMGKTLEATTGDHPRMAVEEGAQFHIGTLSMQMNNDDQFWFTDYKWQSFINRGTVTVDKIDLGWIMGKEHFFTPSFDVRLSEIVPDYPNTPYVFYRYDSGARAAGNYSGTWVRLGADETLRAGQGYAFLGTKTPIQGAYTALHHSPIKGGINYFLANTDIKLPLKHYNGEFAHNRNWNFIGNPYPAFLDIRGVDYDGPMFVYINNKWNAVSALDDELVLDPMCAVFLQASDGTNSITFSAARRQHSAKFEKGAAVNGRMELRRADQNSHRVVYNLTLADGDKEVARTRFVINPETTTGYDVGHDLPQMSMSESESQTKLYTQAKGVAYAINERPLDDGIIRLGIQMAETGTYTMSLSIKGNSTDDVWLIDNETGKRTQLNDQAEGYTFSVEETDTLDQRFVIALGNADPTGISDIETAQPIISSGIYNLSGQPVSTPQRGIYIKDGKKVVW